MMIIKCITCILSLFLLFLNLVPDILPRSIISTEVGPSSISVTVGPVPCGISNGDIISYSYILIERVFIRIRAAHEVTSGTIVSSEDGKAMLQLPDLSPCSTYELLIAAGTNTGYGEYLSVVTSTEFTGKKKCIYSTVRIQRESK